MKGKSYLLIIVCLLISNCIASAQINLDGFGINSYITDAAIDTISGITGIPEGYTAAGMSVSATIKGFTQTFESRSAKLSAAQRQLMHAVKPGDKIYIEDIKIKNNRTQKISNEPVITLIKDGVTAGMANSAASYHQNGRFPQGSKKIYAYPFTNSTDTSQYTVESFEIEAVQPDFVYHVKIKGCEIDSATFAQLSKSGYSFTIKNIVAVDNKTGKRENVRPITISNDNYGILICRSKNYFLKKNVKINFVYPIPTVIDSVSGTFIGQHGNVNFSFHGGTITRDLQKQLKHIPLYSIATFRIYYDNDSETIDVMIVD